MSGCKDCRFMRVPPDKDGKRRVRKSETYICEASFELPPLPTCVEVKITRTRVWSGAGDGCAFFQKR